MAAATDGDLFGGAMYFDSSTGGFQQYNTDGSYSAAEPMDYNPTPTYSSFTSTPTVEPTVDPYAQWGGKSSYDSQVSGFDTQKDNTLSSFDTRLGTEAGRVEGSVLDYLDQYRQGQLDINNAGRDNAYARQSGTEGIMGMVGRGVRQGGMMLQNRNASDSSAAGEIAKAYAQLGQRQASSVGQQYEKGQAAIQDQQDLLGVQDANFTRDFEQEKTEIANTIVTETIDRLAEIDAQIAEADLPNRIALEQEKTRLKNEATTKLSQYDAMLAKERGKVKATDRAEQNRQAAQMMSSGADYGGELFNYTNQAPAQFQNTGPFSSELPIFTRPRSDDRRG